MGIYQVFMLVFLLLLFDPVTDTMFYHQEKEIHDIDHHMFISYLDLICHQYYIVFHILLQ